MVFNADAFASPRTPPATIEKCDSAGSDGEAVRPFRGFHCITTSRAS